MTRLLHVGCGPVSLNLDDIEEIRVDQNPDVTPDIVADFRAIPLDPGSVDVVFASHCLEHIPWPEVGSCLQHWHRLLAPAGKVHIRVPDLDCVARGITFKGLDAIAYVSPMGPVTFRSMLYGHEPNIQTEPGMRHHTGFTAPTLLQALRDAGFTQAEAELLPYEVRAEGVKP